MLQIIPEENCCCLNDPLSSQRCHHHQLLLGSHKTARLTLLLSSLILLLMPLSSVSMIYRVVYITTEVKLGAALLFAGPVATHHRCWLPST